MGAKWELVRAHVIAENRFGRHKIPIQSEIKDTSLRIIYSPRQPCCPVLRALQSLLPFPRLLPLQPRFLHCTCEHDFIAVSHAGQNVQQARAQDLGDALQDRHAVRGRGEGV